MKTFTKFLTMLAVAALFATGCVNEEPPYKEDPNPEPAGTTGYLSIGNLSMTVVYDETEIRPDDTSDETQAARTASGTRATAPDVDSFIVEILDADNAQVLEMTYAQLKEQLKTPMELKVGAYRMEVRSEDTMPGVDWEHPVYGATSDFTITKAQTTSPEEVVCTLQNIKVSVEYSSELADMLADTRPPYRWATPAWLSPKPKPGRPISNRRHWKTPWTSYSTALSPTPMSPLNSASRSPGSRPGNGARFRS